MTSAVLLLMTVLCQTNVVSSLLNDGLYVSNGTNILKINTDSSNAAHQSLYRSSGRIVGLSYSRADPGYLFWSDIGLATRGIYRGTFDSTSAISNVTQIVSTDVYEVNCLSVNWVSQLVYWTDSNKRTVEVAQFDGTNRRILASEGLSQPRGIFADPISGYLYWNDQGKHQIERSGLDGSARQTVVVNDANNRTFWPNQMVVSSSYLYWVESTTKTLHRIQQDGTGHTLVASLATNVGSSHIYGLALDIDPAKSKAKAYVTCWSSAVQLLEVNLSGGGTVTRSAVASLGAGSVFSIAFVSATVQSYITDVCWNTTCTDGFCLPISNSKSRCSCPSYGGKTLYGKNQCRSPSRLVVYALADSGLVGFYDPDSDSNGDLYLVGHSPRPVAVAYDPTKQQVFWSDVQRRTIHRVNLDGTNPLVLLDSSNGVGIVDGLTLDYKRRQLYYTNIGSMTVEEKTYSWHKVETVHVDVYPLKVRTIVSSTADKPRAVTIDIASGYLYYTDWGAKASIIRTALDGSSPVLIQSGLNNPNGLALGPSGKLYVVDSNHKTRTRPDATVVDGSLYSVQLGGAGSPTDELTGFTVRPSIKLPFGVAISNNNLLYVSDWDTRGIYEINLQGTKSSRTILSNVGSPMGLQYSPRVVAAEIDPCASRTCKDTCLPQTSGSSCTCNSYSGRSQSPTDSTTCSAPTDLVLVGDMDGVKMVSLNTGSDRSVYVAATGRPFVSNLVALTYDSASDTAYYSDVNSKTIFALNVHNSTKTEIYRVNHVIDGMTFSGNKLYWTDSLKGRISSLDLTVPAAQRQHTDLKTGLDRPRAIKYHNGYLIWTEWGSTPRVSRMQLDATGYQVMRDSTSLLSKLKWPNGLFVDGNRLFIADGHPSGRQLLNCDITGSSCTLVTSVSSSSVGHIYDIWVSGGFVYFTDWSTKSVNVVALSPSSATTAAVQPLVTGLMRPSQLYFVTRSTPSTSCSSTISGCDSCQPAAGTAFGLCTCATNRIYNGSSCVASSSLTCVHPSQPSTPYSVGGTMKPTTCKTCQCRADQFYVSPTDGNFTCEATDCPLLPADCPKKTPAGQCCPVCEADLCPDGIVITNCPSSPVRVELSASKSEELYPFKPNVRDCRGLSREATDTKTPLGDLYSWFNGPTFTVTVSASAAVDGSSQVDTASCSFTLQIVDVTPPRLSCPDVIAYTATGSATVEWSPTATDSVGIKSRWSTPPSGNKFAVDTTNTVSFHATDLAGLESTCTFNVIVKKIVLSSSCSMPRLQRGQFDCTSSGSSFTCVIKCDKDFVYQATIAGASITCSDGHWDKTIPKNFEFASCLRQVAGSVSASIGVTVPKVCDSSSGRIQPSYTEKVLRSTIASRYFMLSDYPLEAAVKVTGCDSDKRRRRDVDSDVIVTVTVSGSYENVDEKPKVQRDIIYVLEQVYNDLTKGFVLIPLSNGSYIWTAPTVIGSGTDINSTLNDACLPGFFSTASGNCAECSTGTYQSGNECVACANATYNDKVAQTSCIACPAGTTSPQGATAVDACVTPEKTVKSSHSSNHAPVIIGVVVAVGGAILVVVVIIIIVCLVKRHNKNSTPRGYDDVMNHENPAFDNTALYDSIPDTNDKCGDGGRAADNIDHELNHYDSINTEVNANVGGKGGAVGGLAAGPVGAEQNPYESINTEANAGGHGENHSYDRIKPKM